MPRARIFDEVPLYRRQGVGLPARAKRLVELRHEIAADQVVDGPEAGHDRGRSGSEKGLIEPNPFIAVGHIGE